MRKIILILSMFLSLSILKVNAATTCDATEISRLNSIASKVKINYEIEKKIVENENYKIDGGQPTMEVPNVLLDIYNVTDDIFIMVSNNLNSNKKTILYSDTTDGKYALDTYDNFNGIAVYTFDIYAKSEPCKPRKLKSITYTKPIENPLYRMEICQNNLDVPMCSQFVTEIDENRDLTKIEEEINNYRNNINSTVTTNKNNNKDNNAVLFIKDNKYYIAGGTLIVVGIVAGLIIWKKRRDRI